MAGDIMHMPKIVISAALVAVSLGLASPVLAQHHHGDGNRGQGSNRGAESRAQAQPRSTPPPAPAPAPRADNWQRRDSGVRPERAPGFNSSVNNNWRGSGQPNQAPAAVPRSYGSVQGGSAYRNNNGYRNNGYNNGYRTYGYGNNGYRNYSYHNGHAYYYRPPVRFYHPYYSFRPRFSIGFGLWAGYPVPYAYSYYDPFYYGSPYDYAYPSTVYPSTPYPAYPPSTGYPQSPYPQTVPDPNSIGVQPGQTQDNTGGLSFDITPSDAEVVVDGNFVGTVDQFTSSSQPLGLPAGRHKVEVSAPGYRSITFDVNVIAGQVVPYQGSMERR
jgi:PEGA domain-containing protein